MRGGGTSTFEWEGKPSLPLRRKLEAVSSPLPWRSHGGRRQRASRISWSGCWVACRPSVRGEREKRGAVAYSTKRTTKLGDYQCSRQGTQRNKSEGGGRKEEEGEGSSGRKDFLFLFQRQRAGWPGAELSPYNLGQQPRRSPAKGLGLRAGRKGSSLTAPPAWLHHLSFIPQAHPTGCLRAPQMHGSASL